MSLGKYEIFIGQDRLHYFRLKAPNGEIIGASQGYASKSGALNGIASVKLNSPYANRYEYWQSDRDHQWYFHLKAINGEIILRSEGYTTKQAALNGIASVMKYGPTASVVDLTASSSFAY